jgi:hypothetical protein
VAFVVFGVSLAVFSHAAFKSVPGGDSGELIAEGYVCDVHRSFERGAQSGICVRPPAGATWELRTRLGTRCSRYYTVSPFGRFQGCWRLLRPRTKCALCAPAGAMPHETRPIRWQPCAARARAVLSRLRLPGSLAEMLP